MNDKIKNYKHEWYLMNRESLLLIAKKRYEANKEKSFKYYKEWVINNPERRREISRKYNKANREKTRIRQKKYRQNPEAKQKQSARSAVANAIKKGKLLKSPKCSICNSNKKIEAHHHKGYNEENYLNVIWLCSVCHIKNR